jgi:hypothetical protein
VHVPEEDVAGDVFAERLQNSQLAQSLFLVQEAPLEPVQPAASTNSTTANARKQDTADLMESMSPDGFIRVLEKEGCQMTGPAAPMITSALEAASSE